MDFKSLLQTIDTINEDSKVHKGTYGTSHGKEDVRDQYGHRIGKVNKDADGKKEQPKKGRGRPKKGSDETGEVKKYDSSALSAAFGGGKKPNKEVGKKTVKHRLKEYIEEAELALNEDSSVGVKPLPGASEITMNNQPTGITAKDPQSASKIKDLMATGDIALPNTTADTNGVNNSLGEDEQFTSDLNTVKSNSFMNPGDNTVYSKERGLGPSLATNRLDKRGVDIPGLVGNRVNPNTMDAGPQISHNVDEEMMNEKAKSKAQQRFFGMVHAMQQGKKVPGASKELKGVAKGIGKSDAKDFAKTKHKGLPDHVGEGAILNRTPTPMQGAVTRTDPNRVQVAPNVQQSVVDYNKKVADIDARNDVYRQETNPTASSIGKSVGDFVGSAVAAPQAAWSAAKQAYKMATDPLDKPERPVDVIPNPRQGTTTPKESKLSKHKEVDESGLQAYLGNKKYGKDGMDALRKAGQDHASEKKMQNIRAKYSNKEDVAENGDKWIQKAIKHPGALTKKAKAAGQSTQAFAKAHAHDKGKTGKQARLAQTLSKMHESKQMKTTQLTEGAMKDLLINFHDTVTSHMGDGSIFDLKKATNVQQAEEVLKALVKHGDEYDSLDSANQNELVNQTLKYLAHEKQLPFNTFANVDKQRFAQKKPADLSSYRQHPGAKPGSNFSQPGSPMAVPRTNPTAVTGSNGFLKTLSTPTIKESNDMKDKQFESWERELNSLLNEGITVSHSTGQQGSPDSLSINATEHDASELMSILRNSGMEMFGGNKEQTDGYGAPEHGGEEGGEEFHQGVEIAPSPEVVGDGDDMLALIKKMTGIDAGTPGSVEVDYEDEEGSDEEGHDEECDDCGHSPCTCDDEEDEEVDENLEVIANPAGASSAEQAKQIGAQFPQQGGKEPNLAYKIGEDDMDEGNAFTGKLAHTPKGGEFKMGDKTYKDTSSLEEDDMEEGNMFTGNLAKARAQGKKEADLDGDGDMEKVREGSEDCMECGYPMESCGCDHVEEGYANDAGGDAMGEAELLHLRELLGRGNDLHRQKHTQATGNIQKVTMETKLLKDTTALLTDWQKLSGIK